VGKLPGRLRLIREAVPFSPLFDHFSFGPEVELTLREDIRVEL
jgi:hypothetical protein